MPVQYGVAWMLPLLIADDDIDICLAIRMRLEWRSAYSIVELEVGMSTNQRKAKKRAAINARLPYTELRYV